jgi:hypothetical protein
VNHDGTEVGPRRRGPTPALRLAAVIALGALGAVAVTVAVAMSSDTPDRGAPPFLPPSAPPPAPGGHERPPSMQPNVVRPEPAVGMRPQRWTRADASAGGKRLRIQTVLTGGPPCAVLGRVDVEESAAAVVVTLWVGRRRGAQCPEARPLIGFPIEVVVELDSPLGRRVVRDGAD